MSKKIVIGSDFQSHAALLWCQLNAKEITERQFISRIEAALGEHYLLDNWRWYERERHNTLRNRIRKEMMVREEVRS